MKNLIDRLDELEAIAVRWNLDKKVYTSYDQHNRVVTEYTWSQKLGQKRGKSIEFETERAALDWVIDRMEDDSQIRSQIGVDDIRDLMTEEDSLIFDTFFPDAPGYSTWFDLHNGQDPLPEAIRRWRRGLCGIKHREWWEKTNTNIENLIKWVNEQLE